MSHSIPSVTPTIQENLPRLEIHPKLENTSQSSESLATGGAISIMEDRIVALECEVHGLKKQYNNLISQVDKAQAILRANKADKYIRGSGLVNECMRTASYNNPLPRYEAADWTGQPQHDNLQSLTLPTSPSLSKSIDSVVSSESGESPGSFARPLKQCIASITINDNVVVPQTLMEAFDELLNASLGIPPCSFAAEKSYTNQQSVRSLFMPRKQDSCKL